MIVVAAVILTLFFDYPFGNLKKLIFDSKRAQVKEETKLDTTKAQELPKKTQ
jgi:hypothetical protein